MRRFHPFATLLLVTLVLLAACSGESSAAESKPGIDLRARVKESIDSSKEQFAAAQQEYRPKIDAKLAELDALIAKLKQKAAESSEDSQAKFDELVSSLEFKREAVESMLGEWKSIGADQWQAFSSDLNQSVEDLQRSAAQALEKLK